MRCGLGTIVSKEVWPVTLKEVWHMCQFQGRGCGIYLSVTAKAVWLLYASFSKGCVRSRCGLVNEV